MPMGKIVSVYEHFGLRTFQFTNISVYEHFGLRTFRFTNDLHERIKFVNRGLTVFVNHRRGAKVSRGVMNSSMAGSVADWGTQRTLR